MKKALDLYSLKLVYYRVKLRSYMIDSLVVEFSNVGLTILGIIVMVIIVNWLDRNIFNRKK